MPHLRLLTLGPPRVFHRGDQLADLPAQRLRYALLVYLAMERQASRETVLAMFWPDRDTQRGRHALRQMLYELRQLLGEEWIEQKRDRIVVHADVDARDFEEAVARHQVDAALSLYDGEFLEGFTLDNHAFDGWVERHRVQLARRHRRVRREYVAARIEAGEPDVALRAAQRWVELDPLEDEANHALIHCLALTNQRVAALQTYDAYERRLAAELEVEPLEETRALIERIRAGEAIEGGQPTMVAPPSARTAGETPPDPAGPAVAPAVSGLASTPVDVAAASTPDKADSTAWRRGRLQSAAAVTLLLTLLGTAAVLLRPGDPAGDVTAAAPTRILVLPFADHTQDGALMPLAAELTQALVRSLAQSSPLEVVSPLGVALMVENQVPVDSIRRVHAPDYLVMGSVVQRNGSVRLIVELLHGRTGALLRSESVERSSEQTHALVDDALDRAVGILRREIGARVDDVRSRSGTSSEKAWRAYLEGRRLQEGLSGLVGRRDYGTAVSMLDRADSLFARAAELDRRWAEPVIMRGWIHERRETIGTLAAPMDTAPHRKSLEAARSLAERALERDREDPRAWELRAGVLRRMAIQPNTHPDTARNLFQLAEQDLLRATRLDPQSPTVWGRLAEQRFAAGQYAAAKVAAERAWAIDRYVLGAANIAYLLFATSLELAEDADAQRWCAEGRQRFAGATLFTYCLFALHAFGDGVTPDPALLRRELAAFEGQPSNPQRQLGPRLQLLLATTYARAGQADSAHGVLARVNTDLAGVPWLEATVYAALGDDARAFGLLRDYRASGGTEFARIARSRPFWKYLGRPEYEQILRTP